jgi:hypothetical protein
MEFETIESMLGYLYVSGAVLSVLIVLVQATEAFAHAGGAL